MSTRRRTRGYFITFEGIEGSGKSLQLQLLARYLSAQGVPVVVTREPGGTLCGEKLRHILLDSTGPSRAPVTELLLYLADRYQDLVEVVEPALAEGKHVLADRYHDATRAYQGRARGLDPRLIDSLARLLKLRRPDLTLVLDLPVETGLSRARGRNVQEGSQLGRFEAESLRFHRRVRSAYREFARLEPQRFRIVRATGTPEQIHRRIVKLLAPLLSPAASGPRQL